MQVEFVKNLTGTWKGDARLYKVTPPVPYKRDGYSIKHKQHSSYIVISAVVVMFSDSETYIFPSDKNGEILDWGELPGSFQGNLDHQQAIDNFIEYYK